MKVHSELGNGFQEDAYKMEIGLLINFGSKSLEFKRVHNNKLIM